MREEFEILGQSFSNRGSRTDEAIENPAQALEGWNASSTTESTTPFPKLEMSPAPTQPVPIYCGGLSGPAFNGAQPYAGDGWISVVHSVDEIRDFARAPARDEGRTRGAARCRSR